MFNEHHIVTAPTASSPGLPPPPRFPRVSRRIRAFHEAGHAVVAMWFGHMLGRRSAVSVRPRHRKGDAHRVFSTLGRCNIVWNPWYTTETAQIVSYLAGYIAQQQGVGGNYEYSDDEEVWSVCEAAAFAFPHEHPVMDDLSQCAFVILHSLTEIEPDDMLDLIRDYENVTRKLLAQPVIWSSITRVADALMQQYTLNHQQVCGLVGADIMHGAYRRN